MKMDYTLWKSILLDWANSTGFLVKNYENLTDTNIEAFFQEFKAQIKSVNIKSSTAIGFVKDYYPEFHLRLAESENNNGDTQLPRDEYVYVYSLFLHHSCVRYADPEMQSVCSGLLEKYQMIMAKFLEYLIKSVKYTRESIQDAIEEAETCDASSPFVSPLNRSFTMFSSKEVPRTPRTAKLLDNWNHDNRNLKAQLETERFEKGYLEMQVKCNEEKLAKIDGEYKKAMTEINDLKKHITALMEEIATPNKSNVDPMVKRLRKCLDEKEDELAECIQNANALTDANGFLNEKIQYAEKQIKTLTEKTFDLQDDMDKLKLELEDREKVISYMNGANKDLEELVKELRTSSHSERRVMDSSFDLLNSSTSNASFAYSAEENLADAVVDIRLIDQQKQNVELSETVERLTKELNELQNATNDFYIELSQSSVKPDGANVLPETRRLLRELIRENAEHVSRLAAKETELKDLIKLNEQLECDAKESAAKLMEKGAEMSRERQTHEEQMATLQSQIEETEECLATKKAELKQLNGENEGRKAELEKMKLLLETSVSERNNLQSKLSEAETSLKAITETLQTKSAKLLTAQETAVSLQSQLDEANAGIETIKVALQTVSDDMEALQKEKSALAERLKEAEQLVVALNGEIIEAQREATQRKQTIEQKQLEIARLKESIAQLTDEKCQLERDNLSLAHARAKAEERINELSDQVTAQGTELEQQRTESVRKLEICALELDDLKSKLSAAEGEVVATGETVKIKSGEISQLQQDIAFLGEKHATEMQDLREQRDEALAEIESLRAKIDQLQSEVTASSALHAATCDQKDILAKEKSELERKSQEAQATIDTLNADLAAARRAVESEQTKLSECEAENKRLRETIDQMTDDKSKIEVDIRRLDQLRSEAEEKIAALDAKVVELLAEKEDLSKTIKMNVSDHLALNAKMEELKQASAEAEQRFNDELRLAEDRIKELSDTIKKSKIDLEQLKSELAASTERSQADAAKIDELQSEVTASLALHAATCDQRDILAKEKSELELKVQEADAAIAALNDELAAAERAAESEQAKLSECEAENERLKEEIRQLTEDNNQIKQNMGRIEDELRSELAANESKLAENEMQICMLKKECSDQSEATKQCKARIEQLIALKAELEAQAVDLNERLSASAVSLSKSQEECLRIRSEMDEMRLASDKTIEDQQTYFADEKSRFQREIAELMKKCDSIEADLQLERASLATEKSSFEQKLHELTEAKVQMESEAKTLSEKIDSVEAELAQTKVDQTEAMASLRLEAAERESTLTAEKAQLETERAQLKVEIELITSKCEQLEKSHEESVRQLETETAARIASVLSEKQDLEETLTSMKLEMERVNAAMEQAKEDNVTFVKEKNALVTKVIELNRTIDEQQQQLNESKSNVEREHFELERLLGEMKSEKQSLQERFNQMEASHLEQMESLQKELGDSVTKVGQLEQDNAKLQSELSHLQGENKLLVNATTKEEQLNALKSQIAQMQKKHHDSLDKWNKEREAILTDVKIFKAKLMKEREMAIEKDREHEQQVTEVRHEFEEKLEKMKDKMKTLYSAEMSKVKAKHEVELIEHATEMQRHVDKIAQYEDRFKQLSNQLHVKNDQYLNLLKENEIMKSKMRTLENHTAFPSMKPIPTSFMDKIRAAGSTFKMEDEPDELYNENFLEDLKNGGGFSFSGRPSLTAEEISRRNSMQPPHLRSSYVVQEQNIIDDSMFKIGDEHKANGANDSMLSTLSDTRRGTTYKRPGPPTPSKNGGRLSLGGTTTELPRGDILRESNRSLMPSTAANAAKPVTKKSTPGKFRSMFSSAKLKDEMENYDPNLFSQLILPMKFDEFSTSTPQRRLVKLSVPMKFEPISSFCNWENSLSFLRTTETGVYDSHVMTMAVPRPSIELTRAEKAILEPTIAKCATTKRSGKKMSNSRRRRMSFVGACYKRPATSRQQNNKRREKRNDAFSQCRQLIDEEQSRQSIEVVANNATFSIRGEPDSEASIDESYMELREIDAFQNELDRLQVNGSASLNNIEEDLPSQEHDENTNFEQLCHTKVSEHPYDDTDSRMLRMDSIEKTDSYDGLMCKSENEENNNNTLPLSMNSSLNTTSTTAKANSYCTHTMYLQKHKIPQIVRHKSLARISLNSEENGSTWSQLFSAFNGLHPILKYYLIGITVAFVGVIMAVFPTN